MPMEFGWELTTTGNPRAHGLVAGLAMSTPWQARYAFIKRSGHHQTTDGCFAADGHTSEHGDKAAGGRGLFGMGCAKAGAKGSSQEGQLPAGRD